MSWPAERNDTRDAFTKSPNVSIHVSIQSGERKIEYSAPSASFSQCAANLGQFEVGSTIRSSGPNARGMDKRDKLPLLRGTLMFNELAILAFGGGLQGQTAVGVLLPFKQPLDVALERRGDSKAQVGARFAKAIHHFAQNRFVDLQHLGQPVLTDTGPPQLQFEVWIHRETQFGYSSGSFCV